MTEWPLHPLERGAYAALLIDPPWNFRTYSPAGLGHSPERHYETQALDWICKLPVGELAAKDCHLFLWITGPCMVRGYHNDVFDAWGFEPSSVHTVWVKPKLGYNTQHSLFSLVDAKAFVMGMGHTSRQNAEFVVLGRRGSPARHTKSMHQILVDPRREHSRKPDSMMDRVEEYVGPEGRIAELFARSSPDRPRWDFWGDQATKFNREAVVA